jgi:hypothetical protein
VLSAAAPGQGYGIVLQSLVAIDSQGRSIRPQQIQHWLSERLGQPLLLQAARREALLLHAC